MDTCGEIESEGRAEFDVWDFFKEGIFEGLPDATTSFRDGWMKFNFWPNTSKHKFSSDSEGKKWLKRLDSVSAYLKKKENETN